jgi:hypothetical protein
MRRIALAAAILAGLVLVVPTTAQIGSGKIAFVSGYGLHTIDPGGTEPTLLWAGSSQLGGWSPDGSQLAFTTPEVGTGKRQLIVMNADGSGEHVVTSAPDIVVGRHPWSPDGTRIAWTLHPVVPSDIFTASAAGGEIRQLTFGGGRKDPPEWSPDGAALVYSARGDAGTGELFVVATDGLSAPRRLTQPGSSTSEPAWSPAGGWIAFRLAAGISLIRPDGTDLHSIVQPYGSPSDPTWSPDGSKILFETSESSGPGRYGFPAGREIHVVDVDGSHKTRLTELARLSRTDSMPIWSPDGNRILFARRLLSEAEWAMNADGTCEEPEPLHEIPMDGASWQPLPGAPPRPEQRCHAIAVDTGANFYTRYLTQLVVAIANDGTEPLTNVVLDTTANSDVSVLKAQLSGHRQGCSFVLGHVTCRAANLARGELVQAVITVAARRVRIPRSRYLALSSVFTVTTAEDVLPAPDASGALQFELSECTTAMPGGGGIDGTGFRDLICGRQGDDRIRPHEGKDVVRAGRGADVVFAVDGKVDRISCGAGRDTVLADRRDHVARDCERIRRR